MKRDLLLFDYINCMKSGDADILNVIFFKSQTCFRKRLKILTDNSYLIKLKEKSISGSNIYNLTKKGYDCYLDLYPDSQKNLPSRIKNNSRLINVHDRYVSMCRVVLEKNYKVEKWISERELKMDLKENSFEFPIEVVPDGIWSDPKGINWLFEYERAIKTKRQLRKKIENHLMIHGKTKIRKSLFVCKSDLVYKYLVSISEGYSGEIKVKKSSFFEDELDKYKTSLGC